jgi:hypothetical protein
MILVSRCAGGRDAYVVTNVAAPSAMHAMRKARHAIGSEVRLDRSGQIRATS